MIEAKGRAGLARRSLEDLRSRLGQFAEAFDGTLAAATGDRIQTWLDGKGLSPQSTLNFRRVISNFTGFCVRRGCLPKGWDEADGIERPEVRLAETAIYRPAEFASLLAAAPPGFLPSLALAGFAGLRSAEIERLAWEDIDLASGFITVGAAKSKTASRRIVPICDALGKWLKLCAERHGPVWTGEHGQKRRLLPVDWMTGPAVDRQQGAEVGGVRAARIAQPLEEVRCRPQRGRSPTTMDNWNCLASTHRGFRPMKPLTQYGRMAEKHWRAHRTAMVAELEAKGRLYPMLLEAEERTEAELDSLRRHFIQQGLTPQQAHDRAWEIVRERYIFLPPETD